MEVMDQQLDDGGPHAEPLTTAAAVIRRCDGLSIDTLRPIAVEQPVQVSFGEVPFAVMMMTPQDLADFALGFSLTEGVIGSAEDIRSITVREEAQGTVLRIDLTGSKLHAHLARKRAMSGRTGCGLCGIEDLKALPRANFRSGFGRPVKLSAIWRALHAFNEHQPLNRESHAVHGAAWCDAAGMIVVAREDVGRHNALDKLIGALLKAAVDPDDGFVLISSRASFEMIEKTAAFGARTLVAISAPTSLALRRATELDIALIGIARRDAVTVFHGSERLIDDLSPALPPPSP